MIVACSASTGRGCASSAVLRVAVTGAGGQTGQLAFRKMLARPDDFKPVGIVRSEESRAALALRDEQLAAVHRAHAALQHEFDAFRVQRRREDEERALRLRLCGEHYAHPF